MKFEELMTTQGLNVYQQVIMRSWTDPDFKTALDNDPKKALAEFGVTAPDGVTIKTVSNERDLYHLVVAARPEGDELSDDDLEAAAGGCAP